MGESKSLDEANSTRTAFIKVMISGNTVNDNRLWSHSFQERFLAYTNLDVRKIKIACS